MASTERHTAHPLGEWLQAVQDKPYTFGFFHFLRRFECLYPQHPRLGTSRRPVDDPIRLAQEPAMTFESASLTQFEPGHDGKPHRLAVRFFGLLGPNGPLPLHLTEYALKRLRHRQGGSLDRTLVWFLDMFHHRMLSLFYRAWANNEPTVSFDRPESDRFATYVGSLAGLGVYIYGGRWLISKMKASNKQLNIFMGIVFILAALLQLYNMLFHEFQGK